MEVNIIGKWKKSNKTPKNQAASSTLLLTSHSILEDENNLQAKWYSPWQPH